MGLGTRRRGATYAHNLTRTGKTPARFERAAVNDRILRSALPEYRKFLEQEGRGVSRAARCVAQQA